MNNSKKFNKKQPFIVKLNSNGLSNEESLQHQTSISSSDGIVIPQDPVKKETLRQVDYVRLSEFEKTQKYYAETKFTIYCHQFIVRLSTFPSIPKHISTQYPIKKIFIFICQLFLFNELELAVFAALVNKINWNFSAEVRYNEKNCIIDLTQYTSNNIQEMKEIFMVLCCTGYQAKQRMNFKDCMSDINYYFEKKIYLSFHLLYNSWLKCSKMLCSIDPICLNKLFNQLIHVDWKNDNDDVNEVDYNSLVDAIIEISPPYSSKEEADKVKKKIKKKPSKPASTNQKNLSKRTSFNLPLDDHKPSHNISNDTVFQQNIMPFNNSYIIPLALTLILIREWTCLNWIIYI